MEHIKHTLEPIYDHSSRILILGTMPSPLSRKYNIYYGNPQNAFWRVLACVLKEPEASSREDKIAMALRHGIALWDTLRECDITGAKDSSIKNALPNDIAALVAKTGIKHIFTTGKRAYEIYERYRAEGMPHARPLPSTSPANRANFSFEELCEKYREIAEALCE